MGEEQDRKGRVRAETEVRREKKIECLSNKNICNSVSSCTMSIAFIFVVKCLLEKYYGAQEEMHITFVEATAISCKTGFHFDFITSADSASYQILVQILISNIYQQVYAGIISNVS